MNGLTLNTEENTIDIIDLYKIIKEQKKEIEQLKQEMLQLKAK